MNQSDLQQPTPTKSNKNRLLTFNQTFESTLLERPQKFLLDKTLVQGIKQNDPSKIVENGEQADIGQATEIYDEKKEISDIFINTRKKYDNTKQTTVKVQQMIEKLKKEKELLEAEVVKIESGFSSEEREYHTIQRELDRINEMCEAAKYTKDIRLQMNETLKRDILFYKKHCFEANSKIVRNHNKIKTLTNQLESSKKVSSNCRSLIYSIQKKITQKHQQRYSKINSFHEIINKKVQNNMKRQQRQRMIQNSMMQALNGKMPEEQEQKKLLLVNLCLKKMLKMKMQREMENFNQIETIFRKIKQNTTVKRADQFIERFINREKHYGELLGSISKNQEKINHLKQEKQELEKEHHDLMYQKQLIEDQETEKKNKFSKQDNISIDLLRQKLLQNESLKNKCYAWASKFLAAFDNREIWDVEKQISRQKPNQLIRQSLSRVKVFLEELEKKENQEKSDKNLKEIYIQSSNLTLPQKIKNKITRIKTVTTRDQNIGSGFQDHDIAYDDISQREFLNQNRKQIKKSNYLRNRIKTRAY